MGATNGMQLASDFSLDEDLWVLVSLAISDIHEKHSAPHYTVALEAA